MDNPKISSDKNTKNIALIGIACLQLLERFFLLFISLIAFLCLDNMTTIQCQTIYQPNVVGQTDYKLEIKFEFEVTVNRCTAIYV